MSSITERLKELAIEASDGRSINMQEASTLAFAIGVSPQGFQQMIRTARSRKEALEEIDAASAANAKLQAINKQREDLLRKLKVEKSRLDAEHEKACNKLQKQYDEFFRSTEADHGRLSVIAAQYGPATQQLRETADPSTLERIEQIKLEIDRLDKNIQCAQPVMTDESQVDHKRGEAFDEFVNAEEEKRILSSELDQLEESLIDWRNFAVAKGK